MSWLATTSANRFSSAVTEHVMNNSYTVSAPWTETPPIYGTRETPPEEQTGPGSQGETEDKDDIWLRTSHRQRDINQINHLIMCD